MILPSLVDMSITRLRSQILNKTSHLNPKNVDYIRAFGKNLNKLNLFSLVQKLFEFLKTPRMSSGRNEIIGWENFGNA